VAWVFLVAHLLGLLTAVHALMTVRTAQGTIAWILSLVTLPLIALPAYWVLGRARFHGYVIARRDRDELTGPDVRRIGERLDAFVPALARGPGAALAGERLARLPHLGGNEVELLIDGDATFESLLAGVERARRHLLVQFYIVRDDRIGRSLAERLIAKAREGVAVRFLYDEVGSGHLRRRYLEPLTAAGVHVAAFGTTRGRGNPFQLNFRNHRKIVVVDGVEGWVGGHNVGDEYLGRDPKIGPWRDTHLRIAGPSVFGLQLAFLEDWHWATGELLAPKLGWELESRGDAVVLILPSGPADRLETASLMYQQAIQFARERIWIASPYFVPDSAVLGALHLAALRGVDVRLLIPDHSDNAMVDAAARAFLDPLLESGIRIYAYQGGFLHSKHFLVDDVTAGVGTANLDNRSLRLNFEVTAVVADRALASRVAAMFEADLARSRPITREELARRSFPQRAFSRASLLFAPVL